MSDTELLHKSKPEPVRRLEVFTGTGRRRAWTAMQKAEIVAESYVDGESVTAVARRHGRRSSCSVGGGKRTSMRCAKRRRAARPLRPLSSKHFDRRKMRRLRQQSPGSNVIEIVIGATTVRVAPGIDAASRQAVLRAVMAVR